MLGLISLSLLFYSPYLWKLYARRPSVGYNVIPHAALCQHRYSLQLNGEGGNGGNSTTQKVTNNLNLSFPKLIFFLTIIDNRVLKKRVPDWHTESFQHQKPQKDKGNHLVRHSLHDDFLRAMMKWLRFTLQEVCNFFCLLIDFHIFTFFRLECI